jgi:CBS domain-containing protein
MDAGYRHLSQPAPDHECISLDTPVLAANRILELNPVVVGADQELMEIARTMLRYPQVHVACVVDEAGLLVGLVPLRRLASNLFLHIVPEELLGGEPGQSELDRAMDLVKQITARTAADVMIAPVCVKEEDTVKEAFHSMHNQRLSGIPIVNDRQEVTGYINLLELLAICPPDRWGQASS